MTITKKIARFFYITDEDDNTRYNIEHVINTIQNSNITLEVLQKIINITHKRKATIVILFHTCNIW